MLRIPHRARPLLLLQRTQYLRFPRLAWSGPLMRWGNRLARRPEGDLFGSPFFKPAVRIESLLRARAIDAAYTADMQRETATLLPFLPEPCANVLDIGCGIAGIDVLLYRHLGDRLRTLHLLDKSAVARNIFYGFGAAGAFYNSLPLARRVLVANGVPADRIRLIEATDANDVPVDTPLDLVISIISWGFHYPVATYLEQVHARLRPGGRLILDVRKDQGGEAALAARFARVETVCDLGRAVRLAATK
jgi:SAM-dependent methyltransferase